MSVYTANTVDWCWITWKWDINKQILHSWQFR